MLHEQSNVREQMAPDKTKHSKGSFVQSTMKNIHNPWNALDKHALFEAFIEEMLLTPVALRQRQQQ
jgi:cytosine/uracil/thiamine/allantoin permease